MVIEYRGDGRFVMDLYDNNMTEKLLLDELIIIEKFLYFVMLDAF